MTTIAPRPLTVDVSWDHDARVWIAECRELPLFTEAATLDAIKNRVPVMAADLLAETGQVQFDFDISLVVRFAESVEAVA